MLRTQKPVLLIEDDEVDVQTVLRVFKDLSMTHRLEVCSNGEEGLGYLRDNQKEKPCVILLDLNMPKMNGIEFLEVVEKEEGRIKRIPVVVLTTSKDEEDVVKSYEHKAAGYIVKPLDYPQFVEAIRSLDRYWTISELPH